MLARASLGQRRCPRLRASSPLFLACFLRVSCALSHGTALAKRTAFVGYEEEDREQSPVPRLRNDRPKNRSAPPARDDRPACGPQGALTDPGRTWRRQGQPGPPHSCRLRAPALLLHEGQLCGSTRRPMRGRLIRPREGRLAPGDPAAARKLRVREPRHNLLGRDRGPAAHLCSQARSRASDGDALAHRRPRGPPARWARSSQPPWMARSPEARTTSGRNCALSTSSRFLSPRSDNEGKRFPSLHPSFLSTLTVCIDATSSSALRCLPRSGRTHGLGISANSRGHFAALSSAERCHTRC